METGDIADSACLISDITEAVSQGRLVAESLMADTITAASDFTTTH